MKDYLDESQNYGLKVGFAKPPGQMSPENQAQNWR
jgi:hypothetical protein